MSRTAEPYDVIVVGAGPGGSAAALAALRADPGARVLLLDRAPLGRDKVCGDGVGPDAVDVLTGLGLGTVLRPEESARRFRVTSSSGLTVVGTPPAPGFVVPRAELDRRLATAAVAAGAHLLRHTVRGVVRDRSGVVVDGAFTAPVLVGADGANSVVRRAVGQPPNRGRHMAVAVRGYVPAPAGLDELQIVWDQRQPHGPSYAWAFPLAHGMVNVGYGSAGPHTNRAHLVGRAADLLPWLPVGTARMSGHRLPLSSWRPPPAVGRVLLVGDAASLVNPLTGEGIFYALASGALAGQAAVRAEDPGRAYAAALRARFGRHHHQLRLLSLLMRRPGTVEAALRAAARDERVFQAMLSLGLGDGHLRPGDLARFVVAAGRRDTGPADLAAGPSPARRHG